MSNQAAAFVTSVRVDPKGGHEYVSIWIRNAFVGTLCVGEGQGQRLCQLLQGGVELGVGEHAVLWRGSVLDLIADLRGLLPMAKLVELGEELGRALDRLLNPDPPGAERVGKRLPECPNPACINARLLARGATGYRRGFHRMEGKLLEARELFRAVLRGAVPVSVADGIQAWLASPFPKRWPPPDFPTEDEVLAMEREVLAKPPQDVPRDPHTMAMWREQQAAAAVIIDDPPPRHGVELTPEGQARLEAWAAEHCGSDERAEAD